MAHSEAVESAYCPKHGRITNTVQHKSGKASEALSQPSRNTSNQGSPDRRHVNDLRNMNTQKFLHTDLKSYLEKDEHVTCISCQHCVRTKDKLLQFKYFPGLQSSYGANYKNSSNHKKQSVFNLDNERRQLKVDYKPPATYKTTNTLNLFDSKGSGLIGAMTADGKGYKRNGAPKGETEDGI